MTKENMSFPATKADDTGQEGPIRCIFFSEFHPTAGPKITCQVSFLFTIHGYCLIVSLRSND